MFMEEEFKSFEIPIIKLNQWYRKQETFLFPFPFPFRILETEPPRIITKLAKNYRKLGYCLLSQTDNYFEQFYEKRELPKYSGICRYYTTFFKKRCS